jgi:hypothetical protein
VGKAAVVETANGAGLPQYMADVIKEWLSPAERWMTKGAAAMVRIVQQ